MRSAPAKARVPCYEHCTRFTHTISAILTRVRNFVGGLDLGDKKPRTLAFFSQGSLSHTTDLRFHDMGAISSQGTLAISSSVKRPLVVLIATSKPIISK